MSKLPVRIGKLIRNRTRRFRPTAPDLGQHTEEVLRELLGYDDEALRKLADTGVTSTVPNVGEV